MPTNAVPEYVYNQDVRGLVSRLNRFITEMIHQQSANVQATNEDDIVRLEAYLNAMTTYHDWFTAQPRLDLVEASPQQHPLDPCPEVPVIENESIRDVITMMVVLRTELVSSQSSRLSSGMLPFDSNRFKRVVEKMTKFLNEYIKIIQPLDLPESSPQRAMTPAGKTGV